MNKTYIFFYNLLYTTGERMSNKLRYINVIIYIVRTKLIYEIDHFIIPLQPIDIIHIMLKMSLQKPNNVTAVE